MRDTEASIHRLHRFHRLESAKSVDSTPQSVIRNHQSAIGSAICYLLSAIYCFSLLACAPSETVRYASPAPVQPAPSSGSVSDQPAMSQPVPEGSKELLADGVAAIVNGDKGIARDHALSDAQRKAVEQGVGALINSETVVKNFQLITDRIYSKATGYVSSYKILSEEPGTDLYRITIRAVVRLANLQDDLTAIGLMVQKQGRPRLMVLIRDALPGSGAVTDPGAASDLETMLIDSFVSKGFPVVDEEMVKRNLTNDQITLIMNGDNKTAAELGRKIGAEIVVAGKATATEEDRPNPYTHQTQTIYGTKLNVRTINTRTSEILAATVIARSAPFSPDAARRNTADEAATKLVADILRKWQTQEIVTQVYCFKADNDKLRALQSGMNTNLRDVVKVLLRDFTGNLGVIEVLSNTSSQEVYDRLNAPGWTVPFTIKGFSGNRIDLEFGSTGNK